MSKTTSIPRHVGIIMDGNRRWAKKRGLVAIKGHAFATDTVVEKLIERAGNLGIEYLTMWAFSTENWKRDKEEVSALMNLFRKALATKVDKFIEKGARLRLIGDMERFAPDIREGMLRAIEKSKNNTKITVTFALNYGGRDEILRGIRKILSDKSQIYTNVHKLDENEFERYLDTAGMPDPDLIIRTGGSYRLSGFMPWQSVYSELYFTETLFPEFDEKELDKAIREFQSRQRRFGK